MPNNLVPPASGMNAPPTQPTAPTQPQVHMDDVKEAVSKQAAIDRALRGLLAEGGPIKRKEVIDMSVNLVASRVLSAQAMAGYLKDLPEDPTKVKEWVENHAATVEKNLDQIIAMLSGAGNDALRA